TTSQDPPAPTRAFFCRWCTSPCSSSNCATMAEINQTRVVDASRAASTSQSRTKALRQKLLGGSLTLLAGSGLVGVTNLVYNVVTARMLGPTGFDYAAGAGNGFLHPLGRAPRIYPGNPCVQFTGA